MTADRPLRILVTDAERPSALAIIRSLATRGHWVAAASSETNVPAWRSRATKARVRYPSPTVDADGAVDRIAQACRSGRIDLVFPVTDDIGLPLLAARDEVPALVLLPDARSVRSVTDKAATLEMARRLGVPVPPTVVVDSADEALARAPELGWPIAVKPRSSRSVRDGVVRTHSVSYAWDLTELEARVRPLEGDPGVLLQAFVEGYGVGVELLLDRGRPVASFQHRRIHEVPLSGGASSLRESVPIDPILLDHSLRILGELAWTGLAMVEFRVGPSGPVLMEVNGRVWGSLPLATMAGVDFPSLAVDVALGRPPQRSSSTYPDGLRARNLELEALWIASVLLGGNDRRLPTPSRGAGLRALIGLLDPRVRDDVLRLDDPAPGAVLLGRVGQKLLSKARSQARTRG